MVWRRRLCAGQRVDTEPLRRLLPRPLRAGATQGLTCSGFAAPERMTSFTHWPPLQIAAELWAEGGIGPARLAVMERVQGPKTVILARAQDRAAGVAFVALHDGMAMLHGLEGRGYLKSKKERSGRTFRRFYRATALGREANKLAKVQVRELIGELQRSRSQSKPVR